MTGYFRIGGALALGGIIVLSAFVIGNKNSSGNAEASIKVADSHEYITPTDSDGDGTPDWEERATEHIFEAIATPTSTASGTEPYTEPTTFTAKFAQAFFQDYMEGKANGADLSDPSELINGAVSAIEANTESKLYAREDIIVIPDSDFAFREYGNAIQSILNKYPGTGENEANILQKALEKNDPTMLEPLDGIIDIYEHYIEDTLQTPVPASLVQEHLNLINTYEAIRVDVNSMRKMFEDPLYGLARVKRYEDDATALVYAFQNIIEKLTNAGVVYAKDEVGYSLNMWRKQ